MQGKTDAGCLGVKVGKKWGKDEWMKLWRLEGRAAEE